MSELESNRQEIVNYLDRELESNLQRKCDEFVNREVYYCASQLVSELAQDSKYMDDLMPVLSQYQYIHTFSYSCDQEIEVANGEETEEEGCGETWEWEEDEPRTQEFRRLRDIDDLAEFAKPCPRCGSLTEPDDVESNETDPLEAYEHWIVSDWLATKLEEQGEMVLRDFLGLTIWGRCTAGQAISMDGVIRDIVLALGNKYQE